MHPWGGSDATLRPEASGWVHDPKQLPSETQGAGCSPLSPLLFVRAVQPMSAHARQLAIQQGLHGLSLPDDQPSPFLHLHANDTTVYASPPADAQAILDGSLALHVDATGATAGVCLGLELNERCIHGASVDGSGAPLMREAPGASG